MKDFIEKILAGEDLHETEMEDAFTSIMEGDVTEVMLASFLTALRAKGESPGEIASAARVMRRMARPVEVDFDVIDTCGTGGDNACTFNISTAVAFVLAGAGLKVAKHGNRSLSSSSGSADCLEALGIPIDLDPTKVRASIDEKNFAFMFAPLYHPSMKHAMPVRKKLGIRTLFNMLGPLCNPAGAAFQVMGVFDEDLIGTMIEVLRMIGLKGAMVVNGGLDEIALDRPTRYARLRRGEIFRGAIDPRRLGISPGNPGELKVSSPEESARVVEAVLCGIDRGPCRDIVCINAAAALMTVDRAGDMEEGLSLAGEVIDSGEAMDCLVSLRS